MKLGTFCWLANAWRSLLMHVVVCLAAGLCKVGSLLTCARGRSNPAQCSGKKEVAENVAVTARIEQAWRFIAFAFFVSIIPSLAVLL